MTDDFKLHKSRLYESVDLALWTALEVMIMMVGYCAVLHCSIPVDSNPSCPAVKCNLGQVVNTRASVTKQI